MLSVERQKGTRRRETAAALTQLAVSIAVWDRACASPCLQQPTSDYSTMQSSPRQGGTWTPHEVECSHGQIPHCGTGASLRTGRSDASNLGSKVPRFRASWPIERDRWSWQPMLGTVLRRGQGQRWTHPEEKGGGSRTRPSGGARHRGAHLPLAISLSILIKTVRARLLVMNGACGIMLPPLSDPCGGRACQACGPRPLPSAAERARARGRIESR